MALKGKPAPEVDPVIARVRALDERKVRLVAAAIVAVFLVLIFLVPRQPAPPPSPARPETVFVDKVGLVSPEFALETSRWLHAISLFEAVFHIDGQPPPGDLRAWTVRTASQWGIGTDKEDRGLVIFVFPEARAIRAEIGYGLEGALPDARMQRLLERTLVPAFAQGRYEEGIESLVKAVYEGLGGDAESARQAFENAGHRHDSWNELWKSAWKNGARMLPAVWRFYLEGSPLERFGVFAFGAIPLLFAVTGIVVLVLTLYAIVLLPRAWLERRRRPLEPSPAMPGVAAPPPRKGRRRRSAAANGAARAASAAAADASGPDRRYFALWGQIVMGPPVFLLCAGVVVFAFAMAPDSLTRQGQFGGGGVTVTWPVRSPH